MCGACADGGCEAESAGRTGAVLHGGAEADFGAEGSDWNGWGVEGNV